MVLEQLRSILDGAPDVVHDGRERVGLPDATRDRRWHECDAFDRAADPDPETVAEGVGADARCIVGDGYGGDAR